jgi:hypothetical protein
VPTDEHIRLAALPAEECEAELLQSFWKLLRAHHVEEYELPLRCIVLDVKDVGIVRTATGKNKKRADVEKHPEFAERLAKMYGANEPPLGVEAAKRLKKYKASHY